MPDTKTPTTIRALFHCSTTVVTDRGDEGDHQVDALYPDGTIGLSPVPAPAADPAPAPQAA